MPPDPIPGRLGASHVENSCSPLPFLREGAGGWGPIGKTGMHPDGYRIWGRDSHSFQRSRAVPDRWDTPLATHMGLD